MFKPFLLLMILAAFAAIARAQVQSSVTDTLNFGFEKFDSSGQVPEWWSVIPRDNKQYIVKPDAEIKHSGNYSMYFASADTALQPKSVGLSYGIPGKYAGKEIKVRAWMRTADMKGKLGLYLGFYNAQSDGIGYKNLQQQNIKGSPEWKQYSVTLRMPDQTHLIGISPMLFGRGKV